MQKRDNLLFYLKFHVFLFMK